VTTRSVGVPRDEMAQLSRGTPEIAAATPVGLSSESVSARARPRPTGPDPRAQLVEDATDTRLHRGSDDRAARCPAQRCIRRRIDSCHIKLSESELASKRVFLDRRQLFDFLRPPWGGSRVEHSPPEKIIRNLIVPRFGLLGCSPARISPGFCRFSKAAIFVEPPPHRFLAIS